MKLSLSGLRLYLSLAAIVICIALSGYAGWQLRDRDYQAHLKRDAVAEKKAVEDARKVEAILQSGADEVRENVTQQQTKVRVVTRTITKEIPVYVNKTELAAHVDDAGGLPAGVVWVHNQAASGAEAPLPSGVDPDTPTGIGVPELAEVVVHNYGECRAVREEAQGWRDWYVKLKADWPQTYDKGEDPHE